MSEAGEGGPAGGEGPEKPVRHGTTRRRFWSVGRVLGVAAGLVVVLGAGAVTATTLAARKLESNIVTVDVTQEAEALGTDRPTETPTPTKSGVSAAFNLLVIGSDSRSGKNGSFIGGSEKGARSDETMLIHVAAGGTWAMAVNIPRDTLVTIPKCKTATGWVAAHRGMFNAAFAEGGAACTIRTVEKITGVRVDHFVQVNSSGFVKMVNALGGVRVCSPVAVDSYGVKIKKGISTVKGKAALDYVRARHGIGDGTDLGRLKRQQAFVSSLLQKLTSSNTLTNPTKLYKVLNAVTSALTMDSSLAKTSKLLSLATTMHKVGLKNITFTTAPVAYSTTQTGRVVFTSAAAKVWRSMRQDRQIVASTSTKTKNGKKKTVKVSGVTVRTAKSSICSNLT